MISILVLGARLVDFAEAGDAEMFKINIFEYEDGRKEIVEATMYNNMTVRIHSENEILVSSFSVEKKLFNEVLRNWRNGASRKVVAVNISNYHARQRDSRLWRKFIQLCLSAVDDVKSDTGVHPYLDLQDIPCN